LRKHRDDRTANAPFGSGGADETWLAHRYRRCGLGRLAEAMALRLIKALGMRTAGISAG